MEEFAHFGIWHNRIDYENYHHVFSDRLQGNISTATDTKACKIGSTIFSDGWSAYCPQNELGYHHFTVFHKYTFWKDYKNMDTGEVIQVNTNATAERVETC